MQFNNFIVWIILIQSFILRINIWTLVFVFFFFIFIQCEMLLFQTLYLAQLRTKVIVLNDLILMTLVLFVRIQFFYAQNINTLQHAI